MHMLALVSNLRAMLLGAERGTDRDVFTISGPTMEVARIRLKDLEEQIEALEALLFHGKK